MCKLKHFFVVNKNAFDAITPSNELSYAFQNLLRCAFNGQPLKLALTNSAQKLCGAHKLYHSLHIPVQDCL